MAAAREITFESFGVPMSVRTNLDDGADQVAPVLPPLSKPTRCPPTATFRLETDGAGMYQFGRDGEIFAAGLHLRYALEALQRQLRMLVALEAPRHVFVHAGVVAHQGKAIVVPGTSFAGKTTLVAALVRAGALYLSDEFAPLDEHGLVHPFPTALGLRDEVSVQVEHDVRTLGGEIAEEALPVGCVVVTHYRRTASWTPRRLSAGEAAIALLGHTVPAQTRSEEAIRFIARAVEHATALEGDRDEADALAELLLADRAC